MSTKEWIYEYGSGSLRRSYEETLAWYEMYLHERVAMEIATNAKLVHSSRLTTGTLMASPDCRVTTEVCWYARALRWRLGCMGISVKVEVQYYTLTEDDDQEEGAGLLLSDIKSDKISLDWIPNNRLILIPVAIWDKKRNKWKSPENPL